MKQLIKSVRIIDFRSFDDKTIPLEGVSCLVGANESGKTNLLEAISLCKVGDLDDTDDKLVLRKSDVRKNSPRYKSSELPSLVYELDKGVIQNPWLREQLAALKVEKITLIREGNILSVDLPEMPSNIYVIKNLASEDLKISNQPEQSSSEDDQGIESEKKPKSATTAKPFEFTIAPSGYAALSEEAYSQVKVPTSGEVAVFSGSDLQSEIEKLTLKEIAANLNIFFWSYDKDKYSLPALIPIDEIITEWNNRPVIRALFKLGGYTLESVKTLLGEQSETDYDNIFDELSRKVTSQIRNKWSSNSEISIQIRHKGDHLLVNISDPGYSIEPEHRSEGMRWFLAFIIGIVAEAEELRNYVILIDEPALHLHPGGQRDVLKEINDLASDNQIVYSTHSHFMIDRRYSDRVIFLFKDGSSGYALTDYKSPSNVDIFRDPLLRSALLYVESEISHLNEQNILVEGRFDQRVIEIMNTWLANRSSGDFKVYDSNNVSVVNCNGATWIFSHSTLYTDNSLTCFGLYDSDVEGESGYIKNKTLDSVHKIKLQDITEQKSTMEDLLPEAVFDSALAKWEVKNEKVQGKINKPRMKNHVLPAIDIHMAPMKSAEDYDGEAFSAERLRLKHTLEDLLLEELVEYLDNSPQEEELAHLINLIALLAEKTAPVTEES